MSDLSNIKFIKELLSRHGFSFSKSLGQNFIANPEICPRMAELSLPGENTGVIEIGPGLGVLTRELAVRAKKVAAVEIDKRLIPILDETLDGLDNVTVINEDIMKLDLKALIAEQFPGMEVVVCANLPYYITSPVIMMLLESRPGIKSITAMVQKEVADRLLARVGSRDSGAVTVAVNYYSEPELLFNVSRGSFIPPPNVDSAVIRLDVRDKPAADVDEKLFFRMVKAAFGQRRKTILNSVSAGLPVSKEKLREAAERAGINVNSRAEQLQMEQLARLCNEIHRGMDNT